MRALCIIPARGGSKRIPRKNIRPLLGRPLLAWTVAAARASDCFVEIMVSTDDEEIAAVARDAGAVVPFPRSPATATDHAGTTEVLNEVLARYSALHDETFDLACCLYPTAALVQPTVLAAGYSLLAAEPSLDAAIAMQAYRHPIERAYHKRDGLVRQIDLNRHAVRTQDLEAAFHDAGQFYWFRPSRLAETGRVLGDRCAPVLLKPWEAIDLDNEEDWQFLERLAATMPVLTEVGR